MSLTTLRDVGLVEAKFLRNLNGSRVIGSNGYPSCEVLRGSAEGWRDHGLNGDLQDQIPRHLSLPQFEVHRLLARDVERVLGEDDIIGLIDDSLLEFGGDLLVKHEALLLLVGVRVELLVPLIDASVVVIEKNAMLNCKGAVLNTQRWVHDCGVRCIGTWVKHSCKLGSWHMSEGRLTIVPIHVIITVH